MKYKFGRRFNLNREGKVTSKHSNHHASESSVELLPKPLDGEDHPLPYYLADAVTLPPFNDPPWKEEFDREEREKFKAMCRNPKLSLHFMTTFLNETLEEEILAVASLSITEVKSKDALDQETEVFIEEELLLPVVQTEASLCVWELLYDSGRDMPLGEFKRMQKREDDFYMTFSNKEVLFEQIAHGPSWREDLGKKKRLSGQRWEVLLFNYRKKLLQNSLQMNVAFHLMQERVISQVATDEVLRDGVLSFLEQDMVALDEREKVNLPPRAG